ncbi:MAG: hypothetical protein GY943_07995 [Chloroflexi bacterium]|nr:hypothetical protein [Chloroflexota bacterium]
MELTTNGIPLSLKPAFQEYKLDVLHPETDAFTVIERTMALGHREEIRWLFQTYGREKLESWVKGYGWRLLSRRRCQFWQTYFNLPDLPKRNGVWQH